ncbi:hypothetical protein ACWDKQ_33950 [Saccharopolyspora sp. NPDC000995]
MLSQASAFITHAGMGGMTEGLSQRGAADRGSAGGQPVHEPARIVELDLGTRLEGETVTPEQLRAALEQVTTSEVVRRRLKEMRQEIQEAVGLRRAVEILESML